MVYDFNGWVLIYGFVSLVDNSIGFAISPVWLKTCVRTTIIKAHYSQIKKEEKKNYKVLILVKLS